MYGESTGTTGSAFQAGVNDDVVMSKFALVRIATDKYKGVALDIEWRKGESWKSVRVWPVTPEKAQRELQAFPDRFTKRVPGQTTRVPMSVQEVMEVLTKNLSAYVERVVTAFITKEEYKEQIATWYKSSGFEKGLHEPTFEEYVAVVTSMLPPNYPEIKGRLVCGFKKKDKYPGPPDVHYLGEFFDTELQPKDLKPLKGTNFFLEVQPQAEEPGYVPDLVMPLPSMGEGIGPY